MKRLLTFVLIAMAVGANAQFGMGTSMFDESYRPFAVIQRRDVRVELKVTPEQSKQIDGLIQAFANQPKSKTPAAGLAFSGAIDKTEKDILAVLNDEQRQRLSEIRVQIKGATSLSDDDVATELKLTDDQKASIKKRRSEATSQLVRELQKPKHGQLDKVMEDISKQEETDLLAMLTDDQRDSLTKLAGKPFKDARPKGMWPI
ncbi:MAG: hypothetical protein JST51_01025 [Armatimonadetes bacterium]|nr:hypothetical protein [Armatimonadota bacterium]